MEQHSHYKLAGGNFEALQEESDLLQLPDEVWLKILQKISLSDLNNVALVNVSMSSKTQDCSLWKRVKIKKGNLIGTKGIKAFFGNPKFKLLEKLSLSGGFSQIEVIQVLEECQKSKTLKELKLKFFFEIEHVPAALLAAVVAKMEKVTIHGDMRPDQIIAIFGAAGESTSLKDLDVWFQHDLSVVSPQSLAKTMAKLRNVHLMGYLNGHLSAEQLSVIFEKMGGSSFLEELVIWRTDLTHIPCTHLAESKPKLGILHLDSVTLTKWQLLAIAELIEKSTYLHEVKLSMVDLSSLPPINLSRMVSKLRVLSLNLWSSDMSEFQVTAILNSLAENTSLLELTLSNVNLRSVPMQLIFRNVRKIQKLTLEEVGLTEDQMNKIFWTLAENDSLVKLSMSQDLTKVPVRLLTTLIADKTKKLSFFNCRLTEEQKLLQWWK